MDAVMVRYGELFLKSEPVKRRFISCLTKNMSRALAAASLSHRIEAPRGRIFIYGDEPRQISDIISRVFGVVGVSICTVTPPEPRAIADAAVARAGQRLKPGMTFAVRARRSGVSGFTSQELAADVGAAICGSIPGISVNLTRPDYEIFVEARESGGIVYDDEQAGPGGLPLGTQGRVMVLLSDGIDSPVASWLMMRRGCEVIHLHMSGGRFLGSGVREHVLRHHRSLSLWCRGYPLDLLVVDMEAFYERLMEAKEERYRCILCKRFMLMVGSEAARRHGAHALVSGDNLGQVASQTLANMAVIAPAASMPVLRPLIGFDKSEIVDRARSIKTFDPVRGDVGCRVAPRYPSTAAPAETIARYEGEMGITRMVQRTVETIRRYRALNGEIVGEIALE
ncbi:MAG: tRNA 4-thiouridine(8) synthase ThiI [Methanomicrobiaceae archaeon]|uniref:Trna s(4)u 4-thiouridine synthase (Former thii) n=1 Tax=hydrocarbon metagenome TaxID=938273 RepID=A0A0W8FIQ4_9ZZZZ|nr:tRNA 4-thiouridine(8) synthase ThiI [Methanomicrobiaceae archaeon]MDD5418865.1 tRNA 4-thiouridine(8) synthase ThiI [Methanomicrobiaceae archaeon]